MANIFNLFSKRSAPPQGNTYDNGYFGSGLLLNERTLLENPTLIACVNIISRSISLLPLNLFHKGKTGRRKAGWHSLYPILRHAANLEEPASVFIEKIMRDMLMYGNAYIWKSYNKNHEIEGIYSLDAREVKLKRNAATNQKEYEYGEKIYTSRQILHIPGAAYDGLRGYSPANFAKKAIEMGVSLDEYARSAFDNGPNTKLIVDISEKFPQGAKPDDVKSVADYIMRTTAGKTNAGKPFVLFDKMKATPVQISSNKDTELLEARTYQEKVIAQMFQVPLFLLGEGNVTYGNYESAMVSFLTFTLGPWMKRLEQYFSMLLSPAEQVEYYIEFDPSTLLKTDLASKMQSYATGIRTGIWSLNEVRQKENMDELKDDVAGNSHFIEANLMPLSKDTVNAYMASQKIKLQEQGQPADKKVQ